MLKNYKFRTRLILGFGFIILLNIISFVIGLEKITDTQNDLERIDKHPLAVCNAVREINSNINTIHRTMYEILLIENMDQMHAEVERISDYDKQIQKAFDLVFERFLGDMKEVERAHKTYQDWEEIRSEAISLLMNGEKLEATHITQIQGSEQVKKMFVQTQIMIDFAKQKADEFYIENVKAEKNALVTMILLFALLLGSSILIALIILKSISVPIKEGISRIQKNFNINIAKTEEYSSFNEQELLDKSISKLEKVSLELKQLNSELEQKVIERTAALTKNEELLNATEQIAKVGGWEINLLEQNLTWTNETFRIHEVTEDFNPTVENAISFYDEESLPKIEKAVNEAIQLGSPYNLELDILTAKGNRKTVLAQGQIRKNNKGDISHVYGTFQDITERKRAEKIQRVLYNISNAVLTTNNLERFILLIQIELGTILDTTNFYMALYDEKSHAFSLPFHVDQKDKFSSFPAGKSLTAYVIKTKKSLLFTKEIKEKLEKSGEVELFGADAKIWLGVPLIVNGNAIGAFAVQSYDDEDAYNEADLEIMEFISDQISILINRKKTDQDLKKALEKATESDRLKSAFLANMSHEIRTPMNGILGFSNLLREPNLTSSEQLQFIEIIENSGKRMLNIINDLIDISRIEAGQTDVLISEVNLNAQTEYLFAFFKYEAESKGIKLSLKNGLPNDQAIIESDREKIYAILTNLIKNSIKYSNEGNIEFGYVKKNNELEFYVKDTGIGIPQAKLKAVFDRFVQVDSSFSSNYEGAGLGLSITKAYVEMLEGKIWVESVVGQGSQFYFTIPYRLKEDQNKMDEDSSIITKVDNKSKKLNILIVEDEEIADLHLSIILKNRTNKVLHAKTGAEAIKQCRENPAIDLILMDIKMPVMDGHEATRKIREFNTQVVIIAQTAFALSGDKEKAIEAGCTDYISKPIKQTLLNQLIDKYL